MEMVKLTTTSKPHKVKLSVAIYGGGHINSTTPCPWDTATVKAEQTEEIDEASDMWYETVEKAQSTAITIIKYKQLSYPPPPTRETIEIKHRFTNVLGYAHTNRWTYAPYR